MKSIRTQAITALLTIVTFAGVTFTACNKDECEDIVCQHGGTCDEGFCYCPSGFSGTFCEIVDSNNNNNGSVSFTGIYDVTQNCNSSKYTMSILVDSVTKKATISNFGNYKCLLTGITVDANINGSNITVDDTVCNYQIHASGTYNKGTVTLSFIAKYPSLLTTKSDTCTATLVKQ